jgi:GTP cyclohydrolase II
MASKIDIHLTLTLGNASKVLKYSSIPNNPLGGFLYFNMNAEGMTEFISEGARLIAENAGGPENTVLFTAETSTLAVAHELRKHYGYQVQVCTKKMRPDGGASIGEDYCAITSTKSSSIYFDADYILPLKADGTPKNLVFFDNVCTTGETIKAAAKLFMQLPNRPRITSAIVMFTEGDKRTSVVVSDDYKIPIISFGHLPIIDLEVAQIKPQFVFRSEANLPTYDYGTLKLAVFTSYTGKDAIVAYHDLDKYNLRDIPVRVHDACATSELFHSEKCDCREQLENSLKYISENGGMVIYLPQEGRGIGLANKLLVYDAQETKGLDTVDANLALGFPNDIREYLAVKAILNHFNIISIKLITNNPRKRIELEKLGVSISGEIPIVIRTNSVYCQRYMAAKASRMGHKIPESATTNYIDSKQEHNVPQVIRFYEPDGDYGFLSNFYGSTFIDINDIIYNTSEHYYQSCKFNRYSSEWLQIINAPTPKDAFELSRKLADKIVPHWNDIKLLSMKLALYFKFANASLRQKLLDTGNAKLIEASPLDPYWGEGSDGLGLNMLGKLLEERRSELAKK